MSEDRIQFIHLYFLRKIIEHRVPCGLFLAKEGRKWVAVDNSTCDARMKEFSRKRQAIRWLCKKRMTLYLYKEVVQCVF